MRFRSSSRTMLLGILGAILALTCPLVARASDTIFAGYDLFETSAGTTFGGAPFLGAPLGSFDFGGSIGVKPTGTTDTIIHRLSAVGPGSGSTPIEMLALQLVSAVPVDFGLGVDTYFITLQSARGGPASTGTMAITVGPEGSPHGTFDSAIDVFFDVRKGGLAGPIALSGDLLLTSSGTPWGHAPLPGELLIDGVNHFLNGSSIDNDFQTAGLAEGHPTGAVHVVQPAHNSTSSFATPEPGSFALFGAGALTLLGFARRMRKSAV
jgi:hypothetical protein